MYYNPKQGKTHTHTQRGMVTCLYVTCCVFVGVIQEPAFLWQIDCDVFCLALLTTATERETGHTCSKAHLQQMRFFTDSFLLLFYIYTDILMSFRSVFCAFFRLIKKRQKLGVKLFSGVSSSEDVPDIQQTLKQVQEFPQTPSFTLQPELQITEEAPDEIEEAWPNKEGHISTDPLFIFRCSSPASKHENMQTTRTRRKKQNYLNFKKNSVAPKQQR